MPIATGNGRDEIEAELEVGFVVSCFLVLAFLLLFMRDESGSWPLLISFPWIQGRKIFVGMEVPVGPFGTKVSGSDLFGFRKSRDSDIVVFYFVGCYIIVCIVVVVIIITIIHLNASFKL